MVSISLASMNLEEKVLALKDGECIYTFAEFDGGNQMGVAIATNIRGELLRHGRRFENVYFTEEEILQALADLKLWMLNKRGTFNVEWKP